MQKIKSMAKSTPSTTSTKTVKAAIRTPVPIVGNKTQVEKLLQRARMTANICDSLAKNGGPPAMLYACLSDASRLLKALTK